MQRKGSTGAAPSRRQSTLKHKPARHIKHRRLPSPSSGQASSLRALNIESFLDLRSSLCVLHQSLAALQLPDEHSLNHSDDATTLTGSSMPTELVYFPQTSMFDDSSSCFPKLSRVMGIRDEVVRLREEQPNQEPDTSFTSDEPASPERDSKQIDCSGDSQWILLPEFAFLKGAVSPSRFNRVSPRGLISTAVAELADDQVTIKDQMLVVQQKRDDLINQISAFDRSPDSDDDQYVDVAAHEPFTTRQSVSSIIASIAAVSCATSTGHVEPSNTTLKESVYESILADKSFSASVAQQEVSSPSKSMHPTSSHTSLMSPKTASRQSRISSPLNILSPKALPLALMTQRNKLKTPSMFSHRNSPSENSHVLPSPSMCVLTSRVDEVETTEQRRVAMAQLEKYVTRAGLVRSFEDVRLIPRADASLEGASVETHMQGILIQHRERNRDADTNIRVTIGHLSGLNFTFSGSAVSSRFSVAGTVGKEGWGRYPCPDPDIMRYSQIGRGRYAAVYSAQLKLRDTKLMKEVLDAQSPHATVQPSQFLSPTAAMVSSFAQNNRNLFLPPIVQTLQPDTPSSSAKSVATYTTPGDEATTKQNNNKTTEIRGRSDSVTAALIQLKDMADNPFTPRQATLIPKVKTVAIKVAQYLGNDTDAGTDAFPPLTCIAEFTREVTALWTLAHPNILRIEGVCLRPLAVVTELSQGPDLAACLADHSEGGWQKKLIPSVKQQLLVDIASAVSYIHSKRFIHRDIKSHNILVHEFSPGAYVAKLADFGSSVQLMRPPKPPRPELSPSAGDSQMSPKSVNYRRAQFRATHRTASEQGSKFGGVFMSKAAMVMDDSVYSADEELGVVGTMGYTAPEVLSGRPYSYPADVFSFAVVSWELFSQGSSENPLKRLHGDHAATKIEAGLRPQFQATHGSLLRSVIEDCWNTDPTERPFITDVQTILLASPENIPSRSREDAFHFRFKAKT